MPSVDEILARYLAAFPNEAAPLSRVSELLAKFPQWSDRIARTNFVGHLTASGFVLSPSRREVLLVAHRGLGLFLQPGGHIDPDDSSLLDAAIREVREETGLLAFTTVPRFSDPYVPFDMDVHHIPQNPKKGEPEHWHHDFRYLFVCDDVVLPSDALRLSDAEVAGARWVALHDLAQYPTFDRVARKLNEWVLEWHSSKDHVCDESDTTKRPVTSAALNRLS